MRVGLEFNLDNPAAWQQDTSRLYGFMLEMCEEADHLGIDSLLFSEHHVWAPHGHLTQPLVFAAAVAGRTRTTRVGSGVVVAPLHRAVQIAEAAAVVDLVSGGRLDLGLGAGYRAREYELFGADLTRRYEETDRRVGELRALWAAGDVNPLPVQERVPMFLGYMGPKGARRAGLLGEGLLTADAASWPPYRAGLADGGHDLSIAHMAGAIMGFVTDDPDRDWDVVKVHLAAKWDLYRQMFVEGTERPPPRPVDPDQLRANDMCGVLRWFVHDTPEGAAENIKRFTAGAPVKTVVVDAPLAGMSEGLIAQFVQTVCTRLRPLLVEFDPEDRWKGD